MKRLLRCGGLLLLLLAFTVPTFAGGDKQKEGDEPKKKEGDEPKKKTKTNYNATGFGKGKITQLDTKTLDFTLHVSGKVQELDQGAYNHLVTLTNQLAQHQREFAQAKTQGGKQQALQRIQQSQNQIAQQQQKLYKTKDVKQDYKFRPAENCIYRVLTPEPEYDDKGNIIQFTKKDLEKLKGKHPDLPGYHAEADALRNNLTVTVYVSKTPPAQKKKKVDDDDTPVVSDRREAIIIFIENQVAAPPKN